MQDVRQEINLIDGGFQHVNCSSDGYSTEHRYSVKDNSDKELKEVYYV
tara:strand:+ start:204 stop:347 length:144 start_codon:yes stop_codon:yes gene_type:complete